jgi:RNA polymerase sigma-70 factor (ECF subfamily)
MRAAMAEVADQELAGAVVPAAAGDHVAFARIVAAYHEDMCRVCAFVARDEGLAEDAVQTAWSIAWRKLGSLREPERLRTWLMRLAVNEAKKLLDKRGRRLVVEIVGDPSLVPGGVDPATGIDALDMLAAVQRLKPDERALLAMRYIAGFDANELSTALGLSPSGTRTRIERLLGRLRQDLAR